MDTMDQIETAPDGGLYSPAAARNAGLIRDRLAAHLPARGRVLEVAAGSGQHAVTFASAFAGLEWHPTDPAAEALASIEAWRASRDLPNLMPARPLDVSDMNSWPQGSFDAVVCINMVHISPWAATEGLMALAGERLSAGGLLYLYGPYREEGVPLAPSNAAFDESLKSRNPQWGLRDTADVRKLARAHSLRFTLRTEMPANNISLMFRRF